MHKVLYLDAAFLRGIRDSTTFTITLRDAVVIMIIVSDNTCAGTVVDLLGLDAVNAWCRSAGLNQTVHRFGIPPRLPPDHPLDAVTTTTPADTGRLLDLILTGASDPAAAAWLGCTPELCRLAIDILSWQKLRTRLPSLLPLRNPGGSQDRDRVARLHGRRDHLSGRGSMLHPLLLHGPRAGRAPRRHAGIRGGGATHRSALPDLVGALAMGVPG